MTRDKDTGLLLFAHGARDPAWSRPFEATADHCRKLRGESGTVPSCVGLAYLEFMSPGLVEAGAQLVQAGCDRVMVVPLFLGAGGHVRKDIPELLARLRAAHPAVDFQLAPAVGESPQLALAMAQIALACAANGSDEAAARPTTDQERP